MDLPTERIIDGVALIRFPVHRDHRGALLAFDHLQGLPFPLKRVFYVFDVPAGAERAGHAITADCVCFAAQGSLDLAFWNGTERGSMRLDDPAAGLHVRAGVFLRSGGFAAGSMLLVLASECFADVTYVNHPFFAQGTSRPPR